MSYSRPSSPSPSLGDESIISETLSIEVELHTNNSVSMVPQLSAISNSANKSNKSFLKKIISRKKKEQKLNTTNENDDDKEHMNKVSKNDLELQEESGDSNTSSDFESYFEDQNEINSFTYYFEIFKCAYSTLLFIFCVGVVSASIFQGQTNVSEYFDHHLTPLIGCIVMWFLIVWLAMIEGGQISLVGLRNVDGSSYIESHPIAFRISSLINKRDNLEKFIIGRQFLSAVLVFVINSCGTAVLDYQMPGLPSLVNYIFVTIGIAMILFTITFGQLAAQIVATDCMLDFINNKFMLLTAYLSLLLEFTGVMHAVYPVQLIFALISGKKVAAFQSPLPLFRRLFMLFRIILSLIIVGASFAITLEAIHEKWTNLWGDINVIVVVVIYVSCLLFIGLLEGLQIALYSVAKMPEDHFATHHRAYKYCSFVLNGNRLQSFLIGRQICVTAALFVIARITSFNKENQDIINGETLFGLPPSVQEIFNLGFMGAVASTLLGSLVWRVVASSFPISFLSNPIIYAAISLCLAVETAGVCSAAWVLARWYKLLLRFQPDDVYLTNEPRETSIPSNDRDRQTDLSVMVIKSIYSVILLVFSAGTVVEAFFTNQTRVSVEYGILPVTSCVVFWVLIIWLALVEGGQGCMVGLTPIEKSLYKHTHTVSSHCTSLVCEGDSMERFLVGRQFIVVSIIFVLNFFGTTVDGANVWGLPEIVGEIFLSTGLAMMMLTIIVGQLPSQINAANYMLDFINNWFMLLTTILSLVIECTGLLHSSYLVQSFFASVCGKQTISSEPTKSKCSKIMFWTRAILSLFVLVGSLGIVVVSYLNGWTNMWRNIPEWGAILIFFSLIIFMGTLEGLQVALFAAVDLPEEDLNGCTIAKNNCSLVFEGTNLQSLLVGRQACVTACIFIIARITSINTDHEDLVEGQTILGLPYWFQWFVNLGLIPVLSTTILGSLLWRLIASSYPLAVLSNPFIYIIIRVCIFIDMTGVLSSAWVLAFFQRVILFFKTDEHYLVKVQNETEEDPMHFAEEANGNENQVVPEFA